MSPTGHVAFHTTHWTVVLAAQQHAEGASGREALANLCSVYWYPLYAFIRRQGATPEEAEDLTQEFFYRFLERDSLRSATPAAGKFRSFLLVCLKRFLINQRERAHAQRRGGGQPAIPLDAATAETHYLSEPADNLTPEILFDRQWAFTILEQALERLQQEYQQRGQPDIFQALKGFLPGGGGEPCRSELAAKYRLSAAALDVAIHRLRRKFGAVLREQVAQTVSSPAEVEEEIRQLISIMGS